MWWPRNCLSFPLHQEREGVADGRAGRRCGTVDPPGVGAWQTGRQADELWGWLVDLLPDHGRGDEAIALRRVALEHFAGPGHGRVGSLTGEVWL